MNASETCEFYASAAPGTEEAVRDELSELGFRSVRLNRGGIPFLGDRTEGWRACLACRTPQRIMQVLARFGAPDPDALYAGVRQIAWDRYLTARHSLAVAAFVSSSAMTHSGFVALRVKDAIVDQLRDRQGARPDVNRDDPDVRVFVYLARDRATVYLDLAGEPLFRRGYRHEAGEAPLKETLAAVVLRLSGWDRCSPLLDPMCGSGTIPIEAAQLAGNVAPGLGRQRFGFERWADFGDDDARRIADLRGLLREEAHGQHPRITGTDANPEAIRQAGVNARAAGVRLSLRQAELATLRPDGTPRTLVTNPPYGVRLETDLRAVQEMTAAFARLSGWRVAVLTAQPQVAKTMPFPPSVTHHLRNGDLPCDLLVYDIP